MNPPSHTPNTLNPQHQQQDQAMVEIHQPCHWLPDNLPNRELIEGSREDYLEIGVPLYEASMKGDWKAAKFILDRRPELVRYAINEELETPLHVAASAESTTSVEEFVQNIVNMMDKNDLELENRSNDTAFKLAVAGGNVKIAKIMAAKNKAVLEIPGSYGVMPLDEAALYAREDMVRYLYDSSNKMSGDYWTDDNRGLALQKCVDADLFDIALQIVNDNQALTSNKRLLGDLLLLMAKKTHTFQPKKPNSILISKIKSICHVKDGHAEGDGGAMKFLGIIWKKIVVLPKKEIDEIIQGPPLEIVLSGGKKIMYPSRVLFVAAKMGNTRFIIHLIRSYPDLIWQVNDKGLSIFHKAVIYHHTDIYNLLYELGLKKARITLMKDKDGNNMLHLVAKGVKTKRGQNVSGVPLQMQMELLWYKEVERLIPPSYRQMKNKNGDTPHVIFNKKHEMLAKEAEWWMKETAPNCMVVSTLVAAMVFAGAFTLPGGYNQNTGIPMFHQKVALMVFVIADAISLIFSSASFLTFISVFTSRYAEDDFLESLPNTLMFGLLTLFVSIVTMMIAFSSSFFLLYKNNWIWVPIMVTALAAMLLIQYGFSQFRFVRDVFYSTHRSRYMFKPTRRLLY